MTGRRNRGDQTRHPAGWKPAWIFFATNLRGAVDGAFRDKLPELFDGERTTGLAAPFIEPIGFHAKSPMRCPILGGRLRNR